MKDKLANKSDLPAPGFPGSGHTTSISKTMTHRERLQKAIQQLDDIYDEVGYLRDHATPEMQAEYNQVRKYLPSIRGILTKVDNKLLPESLAQKEL